MIKPKNKPCVVCGKSDQPWWSKKRCKSCAQQSYAKTKQTGIKKGVYKPTGERSLFLDIHAQGVRCFITDEPLIEFNVANYAHLLNKKNFKEFRLERRNIIPMCFKAHYLLDFGTEEQRQKFGYPDRWEALFKLREELKEEYKALYGR